MSPAGHHPPGNVKRDGKDSRDGSKDSKDAKDATTTKNKFESSRDVLAKYDPSKNITGPVMSKYERSVVLGMRIEQLARGAHPFVDVPADAPREQTRPEAVAERELFERKIPFLIKRTLPNGGAEYWRIEDMIVV